MLGYIYVCPLCGGWRVLNRELKEGEHVHCDALVSEEYNHDVSCAGILTPKHFSDTW